ncbi:ATP-grasp domain-containing protein [Arthrobacter sp. H-02-3]|uniref:ATP-grasp domain-containing protein n=1 Tax=Arthrobacter sp. H-02-3 TaxID=2703675 RepID=UPI001F2F00F2|nr:alpha-L-glutamate ligase [Arthrobacter sp. H-02-3]
MNRPRIHILHENDDWLPPFHAALEAAGLPYVNWSLAGGSIDLAAEPPEGVFWSRLSASAHTRGHVYAKEYARALFRWLEAAGRRVVNGSNVVEFEVSKAAQYAALAAAGFDVPHTIFVVGSDGLKSRARELPAPFITKHNQGGKGLGVRRFDSYEEFDTYVEGPDFEEPTDGITLLQEYVQSAAPFITRAEFVGGQFVYAVRVDTSGGSFELCPAEACAVPEQASRQGLAPATCDLPASPTGAASAPLFMKRNDITASHPLIVRLRDFLAAEGIEVAGVEFFETVDGRLIPYDINTNTNYNPDVESATSNAGATSVAEFLGRELASRYTAVSA